MFLDGPVDGRIVNAVAFAPWPGPRALVRIEPSFPDQGAGGLRAALGWVDNEEGPSLRSGRLVLDHEASSSEAVHGSTSCIGVAGEVALHEVPVGDGPVDGNVHEGSIEAVLDGAAAAPPGLATSAGPGVPARELRPDSLGPGSLAAAGGVPAGAHRLGPSAMAAIRWGASTCLSAARSLSGAGARSGTRSGDVELRASSCSRSISSICSRARSTR